MTFRLRDEPDESLPDYQPNRLSKDGRAMVSKKRNRITGSGPALTRSVHASGDSGRA